MAPIPNLPTARPDQANMPASILSAWIALEALSPQTYRRPEDLAEDRFCVARLDGQALPWTAGERSRPNKKLYYQITLGCVNMSAATKALISVFGDDDERPSREREKAVIAAILVDKEGVPLEENAIAVSSFAWALPIAMDGRLGELGAWPSVETGLIEGVSKIVRRADDEGNPVPIDAKMIQSAYDWLVKALHLPSDMIERPTFALRVYHYYKAKNPPEVSLLNSFFLGDLAICARRLVGETLSEGLRRYLNVERTTKTYNLSNDTAVIEAAVAPSLIPLARWPSPGGHPLVLLQRASAGLASAGSRKFGEIRIESAGWDYGR